MTEDKLKQEEKVIRHIKGMLYSGELNPGDKLPAERKLAEQLGVGRVQVRSALQKLEFYGIIKTFPQSGSIVAQLKVQALERIISDILKIDPYDFLSLVEVRVALECLAIRSCATNRDTTDLEAIEKAMIDFEEHMDSPDEQRADKDFAFHQAIAQGSHNPVAASMLLIINPDILRYYRKYNACLMSPENIIAEHREIFKCISEQDPDKAENILLRHLSNIREFARTHNKQNHHLESHLVDI